MEPQARDALQILEQRRLQLENQLADLDKALLYWRSSETDYEIFKEDILAVPETKNHASLDAVGREFKGSVLKPSGMYFYRVLHVCNVLNKSRYKKPPDRRQGRTPDPTADT